MKLYQVKEKTMKFVLMCSLHNLRSSRRFLQHICYMTTAASDARFHPRPEAAHCASPHGHRNGSHETCDAIRKISSGPYL